MNNHKSYFHFLFENGWNSEDLKGSSKRLNRSGMLFKRGFLQENIVLLKIKSEKKLSWIHV